MFKKGAQPMAGRNTSRVAHWYELLCDLLPVIRWRLWTFLGAGFTLVLAGLVAKAAQSTFPPELPGLFCDLTIQIGMAIVGAVVIGSLIDVYLESRREDRTLAKFLRQVFNYASNLPPDDLHRIVEHFLDIRWIRGDIEVDITLTSVAGIPDLIQADTELRYSIRCIAADEEETRLNKLYYFPTRQRLSAVTGPDEYEGSVEWLRVKGDRTSLEEHNPEILKYLCFQVGRYRCFDFRIEATAGSEVDFAIRTKRFLKSGEEDSWDSRVPAKSIVLCIACKSDDLSVEALRLEPKNSPGRWSTNVPLAPTPGGKDVPEGAPRPLVFQVRPVLPFEGMIIRYHRNSISQGAIDPSRGS